MGYYSTFRGVINIDPPIPWIKLHDTDWTDPSGNNNIFYIVVDEDDETVQDYGVFIRKEGTQIECVTDEAIKGYEAQANLRDIIWPFRHEHNFNGTITVSGEANGDYWRLRVADNEIYVEKAKLVWPDGREAIV